MDEKAQRILDAGRRDTRATPEQILREARERAAPPAHDERSDADVLARVIERAKLANGGVDPYEGQRDHLGRVRLIPEE